MTVQTRKKTLRQSIIADRALLAGRLRAQWSREIGARLLQLDAYRKAGTVLGYMSFGAEFESDAWVRQVVRDGKALLLPRVNTQTRELDLYRVVDVDMQLAMGAYGIREPQPERCEAAGLHEADFILMPGVAFGRDGARLGYGGGFYDKLLACLGDEADSPALVAAAFGMQLVEGIPQEATDRKVAWLVTETETINCTAACGR